MPRSAKDEEIYTREFWMFIGSLQKSAIRILVGVYVDLTQTIQHFQSSHLIGQWIIQSKTVTLMRL